MEGQKSRKIQIAELITLLEYLSDYYNFDTYRVAAYDKAIQAVKKCAHEYVTHDKGGNRHILSCLHAHVGVKIYAKIEEFMETGRIKEVDDLKKRGNTIFNILGFDSKTYDKYKLYGKTATEIKKILASRVETHQQMLGLKYMVDLNTRIPRDEVEKIGKILAPFMTKYTLMGSYRRGQDTSGDVDILTEEIDFDAMTKQSWFIDVISRGTKKTSILVKIFKQVRHVDIFHGDASNPAMILYLTGSKQHNLMMRARAKEMGMKLNQYGLFRGEKMLKIDSERDIFAALNLKYASPRER